MLYPFLTTVASFLFTLTGELLTLYLTLLSVFITVRGVLALAYSLLLILLDRLSYRLSVLMHLGFYHLRIPLMYALYYLVIRLVLDYQVCWSTPLIYVGGCRLDCIKHVLIFTLDSRFSLLPRAYALELTDYVAGEGVDVPYVQTYSLTTGLTALNKMYNHYPDSSPLKQYLNQHCKFLLKPLTGSYHVPYSMDRNSLLLHPSTIDLTPRYSMKAYDSPQFYNTAGVYFFIDTNSKSIINCGSTLNWANRMQLHYQTGRKEAMKPLTDIKPLYLPCTDPEVGLSAYHWHPIIVTKNFHLDYSIQQSTSGAGKGVVYKAEAHVLISFTRQYVRSVEQAMHTYLPPVPWNGGDINVTYANWHPGKVEPTNLGFAVAWTNKAGEVYTADSIGMARSKEFLGLNRETLMRNSNCIPEVWVDTEKYGLVSITIKDKPYLPYNPVQVKKGYITSEVDWDQLLPDLVYLYDKDFNQLELGPFKSAAKANVAIGQEAKYRSAMYVNHLKLIAAPALGISVYYVKRVTLKSVIGSDKSVDLHNVNTGETSRFNSIALLAAHLAQVHKVTPKQARKRVDNFFFHNCPIRLDSTVYSVERVQNDHYSRFLTNLNQSN